MKTCLGWFVFTFSIGLAAVGCDSKDDPKTSDAQTKDARPSGEADEDAEVASGDTAVTVLDLNDVKSNPDAYTWFDFRPNVKKLILSGAAETEHIAILWYTTADGGVGLHYHSKTESVYVIDGTQTDMKGVYSTGSLYFNPPGSGHQITDSSGFFLLSYASPPDFMKIDAIEAYTPVRIDTTAADLTTEYAFEGTKSGVRVYSVPLDVTGGMAAEFIEITASKPYAYTGNYLLVLKGTCEIGGVRYGEQKVIVAKAIEPHGFAIAAADDRTCLALGVSF